MHVNFVVIPLIYRGKLRHARNKALTSRYIEGQQVFLNFTGHPEYPEDFVSVTIIMLGSVGYKCERRTHEPIYSVEADPDSNFMKGKEHLIGALLTAHESGLFNLDPGTNTYVPVNMETAKRAIEKRKRLVRLTRQTLSNP